MSVDEFKALSDHDREFFEYLIDKHDVYGFEELRWWGPNSDWLRPEVIPTLKGKHLLKYHV